MAADDAGEKTEDPTPRRREEAREEGQIARSTDLTAAVALLAGLLLLKTFGADMLTGMLTLTQALGHPPGITTADLAPWMATVVWTTAKMLGPFLALLVVITIAVLLAQSGILLTWKKLTPKPDRISPIKGVKRLFSPEAVARMLLGLSKVGIIAAVAYMTITGRISTVLTAGTLHTTGIFDLSCDLLFDLALRMGLILLLLGIVDYIFQRRRLEKQLRMSKQEVRDELKKMEGDPLIKQRRRQLQARLAMQRIGTDVPRADVVVTNPTEYAVAIKYDEAHMSAPRVIAKGRDLLAARIRQVAQLHGITIVQRPPLARALYAGVDVGQEVPPQFYRAIAELLAYVYQVSGRVAG